MIIGPLAHQVNPHFPWNSGAYRTHYIVLSAPRIVQPWWQFYDPVKLRTVYRQYRLHYLAEFLGYVGTIVALAYLYGWHVVPTVCRFFSGYFQ